MWLLNTESLQLKEFYDSQVPPYAILSHRWGDNEVSFQEFQAGSKKNSEGHEKIANCCSLAGKRRLDWAWIDTCCINKQSSAELSEAINSMFEWYKNAKECYVYLNDVHWVKNRTKDEVESSRRSFRDSKWFTRGWTLQELLAPSKALFFDKRWKFVGNREKLSTDISTATSIDASFVRDYSDRNNRQEISVAMKMAWVAKRETTRSEDMAYCMLGIFDVNMPLLYGERRKAFLRLQLEIIRKNDDESIFAWTADGIKDTKDTRYTEGASLGMLATWPSAFKGSGDVFVDPQKVNARPSYSMTNKGLEFPLKREPWERDHSLVPQLLEEKSRSWQRARVPHRNLVVSIWPLLEKDPLLYIDIG